MNGKPQILIVDDDKSISKTLLLILKKRGYETHTASTGQQALERARERFFNLVLLDIRLPDIEGIALIAPLKRLHPDMAVILATAYASRETAIRALNEGAAGYVTKPLDMDQVLSTIRDALEKQRLIGENRRLFEAAQRELAERKKAEKTLRDLNVELERRNRQLTALFETGRALAATLDEREIYQIMYREVSQKLFGTPHFTVAHFDEDDEAISCGFAILDGEVADPAMFPVMSFGEGPISDTIRTRTPRIVDLQKVFPPLEEKGRAVIVGDERRPKSALYAPLIAGDKVLGSLIIQHYGGDAFHDSDIGLVETLASQAAVAMANARLFAREQRQSKRLQVLNAIIATAAATTEMPDLLETALDQTLQALALEIGAIWLPDEPGRPAFLQFVRGLPAEEINQVGVAAAEAARSAGLTVHSPQAVEDWQSVDGSLSAMADAMLDIGVRASLTVPVVSGEQPVGAMSVASDEPRSWAEGEIELVDTVGRQIGEAVERARLFAAERARSEQLDALYRLSRELIALDKAEEVLSVVARHTVESAHATFCRVLTVNDGEFVCRAAHPTRVLGAQLLRDGEPEPAPAAPHLRRALQADEPLVLLKHDETLDSTARQALMLDTVHSLCLCPLRVQDRPIGLLALGEARHPDREPFDKDKQRLLIAIAGQAANAIHRATLHEQAEKGVRRLTALRKIDTAIGASVELNLTLDVLLNQVMRELRVDAADVLVFNPHTHLLEFRTGQGFRTTALQHTHLRLGQGHAGRAALERRRLFIPNLPEIGDTFTRQVLSGEGFVSYFAVPLLAKGQLMGVMELFHRTPLDPDRDWLEFLEALASQAAIAIDNATLFADLQRSNVELTLAYDTTLEGWARTLELRDGETEGHSRRVTDQALRLARAMGVPDDELAHLRRGALLHDIGKTGVPDRVLLKPGPLDEAEWEIMRQHPVYAFELLSPIPFLRPALDIPYSHHERWDGSGYPNGLKGEHIPLVARIFAVVDVYDALTSDRPYRKAWPREKAIAYLREQAGQQFDPQVVETFLRLISER